MNKFSVILAALATSLTLNAASLEFTYNPNPESTAYKGYGFSKKEFYDVAIRITDPSLIGTKITGLSVPIPAENSWITDLSGWISSELSLDGKVNKPDIASVPAEINNRKISVTFPEPYQLTETGVYVGYSFKVTELGNYSTTPVACAEASVPGGLYLHTSRTRLKWTDEGASTGYVSAMTVFLESESGPTDAALSLPAMSYILAGSTEEVTVNIINYGTENLEQLGYTWTAGPDGGTSSVTLAEPLVPGGRADVRIPIGPCNTPGNRILEITADTFNGKPNTDSRRKGTGNLAVMPFIPVNRPVVEEFTGLLCPNCPRAYVSMAQMSDRYPDRFIGMAYHSEAFENGGMVVMPDSDFPVDVSGYPEGRVNRSVKLDMQPEEVNALWSEAAESIVPADIDVTLEWMDATHTQLQAKAKARFAMEFERADFRLSLALLADGLTNSRWAQRNNYVGLEETGDYWDLFTKGTSSVKNLVYNEVVVSYKDTKGIEGSVPSTITFDTEPELTATFNVDDITNLRGDKFLSPGCSLHAVGLLLDASTGAVLNAAKSNSVSPEISAVDTVEVEKEIVSTEWYDLQGNRIDTPVAGNVTIRVDLRSDGTLTTSKSMVKQYR